MLRRGALFTAGWPGRRYGVGVFRRPGPGARQQTAEVDTALGGKAHLAYQPPRSVAAIKSAGGEAGAVCL